MHEYDVFLCHDSRDKPQVRQVCDALKARGLNPWLDQYNLTAGDQWRQEIEKAITSSRAVAVFFGNSVGKVQELEMTIALSLEAAGNTRVIPVKLPVCDDDTTIPPFLTNYNWVDFGIAAAGDPLLKLATGVRPDFEEANQPTVAFRLPIRHAAKS